MKRYLRFALVFLCFFSFSFLNATDCEKVLSTDDNPFLNDDMFDNLDFSKIKPSHYLPALDKGIEEANAVIDKIINSKEEPTFENVILPLEYDFKILDRVGSVFFNMASTISNEKLREIENCFRPKLSEFNNNLNFNKALFKKIEQVYNKKDFLNLSPDALRVLELTYKGYIVKGINLPEDKQNRIKEINLELSRLGTDFKNNLLKDTKDKFILIKDEDLLDGLSDSVKASFAAAAKAKKMKGYLITASRTDTLNVLTSANNRNLREQAMDLYTSIGEEKNITIAKDMVNLRIELANIMEKSNYADYILENYSMAKTSENAFDLMDKVWVKALAKAKTEKEELEYFAKKGLGYASNFELKSWDWFYLSEKLRASKFNLNMDEFKKYFELSATRKGLFTVLAKLYDLEFIKIDKSVYHEDVEVYKVQDLKTKKFIGELYLDYFAREGKNAGAWTSRFREQSLDKSGNNNITPIVICVFNFLKAANSDPTLLSLDNVETLFHEVGHAIHGLLLNSRYPSLSSGYTRDFVELPSQILEKWAFHRDVLPLYAKHYQTGETISNDLIEKMEESSTYGTGFVKVEYLSAAILDMKLHLRTEKFKDDLEVKNFEKQVLDSYGLLPEIVVRYKTPYFKHIFSGGYYARYYAYLWSDVLVSDAFSIFEEKGVFNREVADSFKNNVLSRGNSEDSSILYERFSGRKNPSIDALMKDLGFDK